MRHLTRRLPKSAQSLGFQGAGAPGVEIGGHGAHTLSQHGEFRRSPGRRAGGQGQGARDAVRPSHQLIERPAELAGEMAGHARRDDGEQDQRACGDRQHDRHRPHREVAIPARLGDRHRELLFVRGQRGPCSWTQCLAPAGGKRPLTSGRDYGPTRRFR